MENRRVFQRTDCRVAVVVHHSGKFLYGELVDLSLGGARLALKKPLEALQVELSPHKGLPDGVAVIPLPYDVCWQEELSKVLAGLQFAGGTDAFFRGWLSAHLEPLMGSLLDHRKLVRIPCQLQATAVDEDGEFECSVLDLSLGGVSLITQKEMLPGMSLTLHFQEGLEASVELILLRVQPLTGHYLCGGKFLEPEEGLTSKLQSLLQDLASSHRETALE